MNATPRGPSDGDPDAERLGLASLVSNLPGMVYRCRNDRERSAELVSAGVARICGHAPAAFTSGRMHWGQIIHPDDRDRVRTAVLEAIGEGRPYRFEYRIRHRDGSERWVWEQGQAVGDAGGAPVVLEGYVTDVTADRQAALAAEELARQRLAELEDVYRNAPVGLCLLDRELRFRRINERLAEINGIPAAEHLGKTVRELMPQLADAVEPDMRHILATGEPKLNIEIVSETAAQPDVRRSWREQWLPVKDGDGRVTGLSIAVEETTARKEAEAALARERDLLQAVLNSAGKAHLVYLDRDFNFVRVNETYAATCGYRPEEMIGKNHFALYPHAENADIFRRVRDTGKPFEVRDKPFEFPDQPERGLTYWDWTLIPVKDGGGQVVGLIFSLFETTARVRVEEALRESEKKYRNLFANMAEEVHLWQLVRDEAGHIETWRLVDANLPTLKTWGRQSVEEIRGKTTDEIFGPGSTAHYMPVVRRIFGDGVPYSFEDYFPNLEKYFRFTSVPFGEYFITTGADITPIKKAQDALRRSEARWSAAIETFAVGAIIATDDEQVIYWNPAAREMHGLAPLNEGIEPLENTAATFQLWTPDGSRRLAPDEWPMRRIKRGEPVRNLELRIGRPDQGWEKVFSYSGAMVETAGGERLIFLTCHDLTELRRAERALLEADRRKTEFLAVLAHELRNPLAPIRNAVHILKLKGTPDPALRMAQDIIDRQLTHMVRLIDDLLDVSRITRGQLQLRKERVELAAILDDAVESARPHLDQAAHALTVSLPPEPLYLDADPVRLTQVFLNLLNNAAKYTERGGRIGLAAELDGTEAVVTVSDNGIGIPQEHLSGIFEMFSQAGEALARCQGGLGIGLALTKGLVQMHGGSIEARSKGVGKGSAFIVRLPAIAGSTATAAPGPAHRDSGWQAAPLRILVADDNRDGAESLAMMLARDGNQVETAYDGLQAVEAAARFRPDVILLDIGMPRLDGYAACRRIREQSGAEGPLIYAMTGWGQEGDHRESQEAGFDGHLVKPIDPTALLKLLAESAPGRS